MHAERLGGALGTSGRGPCVVEGEADDLLPACRVDPSERGQLSAAGRGGDDRVGGHATYVARFGPTLKRAGTALTAPA